MEFRTISPSNWFLTDRLSPENMEYLWKRVEVSKKNNSNMKPQLAGIISESLSMDDPNDLMIRLFDHYSHHESCIGAFQETFSDSLQGIIMDDKGFFPVLESFWVNHQYKHEFNPMHRHGGTFSFVIWMDIPYNTDDQKNLPIAKSSNSGGACVGNFCFVYSDGREIRDVVIEMHPGMNGSICIFPAHQRHMVYPFYECDEPRISISGNIYMMQQHEERLSMG